MRINLEKYIDDIKAGGYPDKLYKYIASYFEKKSRVPKDFEDFLLALTKQLDVEYRPAGSRWIDARGEDSFTVKHNILYFTYPDPVTGKRKVLFSFTILEHADAVCVNDLRDGKEYDIVLFASWAAETVKIVGESFLD